MALSPEQELKLQARNVAEYTKLVTDPTNLIGLNGHQPTLRKIRKAYHNQELTNQELRLVLTKLAQDLKGESEIFASQQDVYKLMFPNGPKPEPKPLTKAEQAEVVRKWTANDPKKKKYSGPRRKAVKKVVTINKSALPAHLRHLV